MSQLQGPEAPLKDYSNADGADTTGTALDSYLDDIDANYQIECVLLRFCMCADASACVVIYVCLWGRV